MDSFEELTNPQLENIGWEEFTRVVEALAGVERMSLELEQKAMETDTRPLEEWETMPKSVRSFVPRPGVTSVTVVVSAPDTGDEFIADLLKEKLGRLQDKGVGLTIHFT